jgi:branched-subunit amino acid transport protein AzlD
MEKLGYFCQYTPLKVMLISIVLSCLLAIGIEIYDTGAFNVAAFSLMFFLGFASINFILSILSFSIYFNVFKRVRESWFLSFLSFFLPVPVLYISVVALGIYSIDFDSIMAGVVVISPFLIPQIYYFTRFRIMVKRGYFDDTDDYDSIELKHD